jgi:hypothetical protein
MLYWILVALAVLVLLWLVARFVLHWLFPNRTP